MIPADVHRRLTQLHELAARVDSEIRTLEGSLRAQQFRKAGARQTRRSFIVHGTNAGYQWHIRHGLPFDADDDCGCREAHAAYVAQATRRRRARKAVTASASVIPTPPGTTAGDPDA